MARKDTDTSFDSLTADPIAASDPLAISTDRADYAPGDTVTSTLSGIKAGSTYTFQIQDLPSAPGDDGQADVYKPFTVTDGGKGDLDGKANGQIVTAWTVPHTNDAVNATLSLTATGNDGTVASTTFTDAPPASSNVSVRLDQWADGPAPDADGTGQANEVFVNGNLNQTKAHYNEGDAIPYRVLLDDLNPGTTYGLKIQWDTVDSGAYALDYLTGFNFSFEGTKHPGEPDVTPTAGINDLSSGTVSSVAIPSDSQLLTGFGAQFGVTDGLASGQPSGAQFFTLFGAVSALSTSAVTYNADHTKASITINFMYTGSAANNADSVVVAWGGHIASSLDWRDDPGETVQTASDISGSPYHTRVLSLFKNGIETSIGNQDRSLSAAAVLAVPPIAGDVSLLADEDNITGGNNDVQAGDDNETGLTGTLPVTDAASVNFADLHLDPVLDTSSAAVTSSGTALTFFWDDSSATLYASTNTSSLANAQATAAFKIQVAAASPFNYTFTLFDQIDHPSANGTPDDNSETPNVLIDLTYTAVGGGGSDTGIVHVTIDDDIPIASQAQQTGTVDEDGVPGGIAGGTGDVAGEATVASGSLAPLFNSGADQPLAFSLKADTSGLPALISGGVAVTYAVVGNLLTASAGGNTVFTFALDGTTGAWTFTLVDQLDHPSLNGQAGDDTENDLAIDLSSILQATDFDSDTVTAAAGALVITVDDDTPQASQAQQTGTVDEDGVPGGIAGGTGDVAGEATVASGSLAPLFNSGADQPLAFSLKADTSGLPALISGGVAVTYAVVGNLLTASAGGNTVFTFALDGTTGAWTFTLVDQLDHPSLNGQAGDDTENDLAIDLSSILQATDFDSDTVTAAAGALVITVDDDTPVLLTPAILSVDNAAGATDDAALGAFGHVGADQPGTSVFVGTNGTVLQGTVQDGTPTLENLKSGGSDIFLFGFGTNTLIATTDATNIDATKQVFQMTLNPDGAVQANDLYDITMLKAIDNLADVNFGAFTAAPASGNPLTLVVNDIGGSTIDALFSGFVDQSNNTTTQTTVNVSGAGVGVGTGQDFNFDPQTSSTTDDLTDRISIQFLEDDGDGVLETGETGTVNRFTFVMNQNNPPADDGDALIRVFDQNGNQVQITGILVNGQTLVGPGGAPVPSNDPGPGGNVTATANGLGYELHGLGGGTSGSTADNDIVTIITASGYSRIDASGIGNDSNKDTFDILLQSVAISTPFDIFFNTQANLSDADSDTTTPSQLEVHLLA
jgi:T1SS-143 domain-containing protein